MKTFLFIVVAFWGSVIHAAEIGLKTFLIEGEEWQEVASGFEFTEGPASDGKGMLYFSDPQQSRIYRIGEGSKVEIFLQNTASVNGLMFGPDGKLYGCQNGKKRIVAYDVITKEETVVAEGVESNDLVVRRDGTIYFTDPKNQQVWFISADRKEKRVVDKGITNPNGLILWPNQQTLMVADTLGSNIWAFRIELDGSLAFKQPLSTMRIPGDKRDSGADGSAMDTQGRLYQATHAGVQVFDNEGRLIGIINNPSPNFVSNVDFGGRDMNYLYATSRDKLWRRKLEAKGVLFFQP